MGNSSGFFSFMWKVFRATVPNIYIPTVVSDLLESPVMDTKQWINKALSTQDSSLLMCV